MELMIYCWLMMIVFLWGYNRDRKKYSNYSIVYSVFIYIYNHIFIYKQQNEIGCVQNLRFTTISSRLMNLESIRRWPNISDKPGILPWQYNHIFIYKQQNEIGCVQNLRFTTISSRLMNLESIRRWPNISDKPGILPWQYFGYCRIILAVGILNPMLKLHVYMFGCLAPPLTLKL